MSIERLEFNSDGFAALLKSSEVQQMIQEHTDEVKARADAYIVGDSEGFKADVRMLNTRPVGLVGTTDDDATMIAASEQKALQKAVNAS